MPAHDARAEFAGGAFFADFPLELPLPGQRHSAYAGGGLIFGFLFHHRLCNRFPFPRSCSPRSRLPPTWSFVAPKWNTPDPFFF